MRVRDIISHCAAMYLGAGLSLGAVMAQVLPLSGIGVAVYATTWPRHVYCARPAADCFADVDYVPIWLASLMFNLDEGAQ